MISRKLIPTLVLVFCAMGAPLSAQTLTRKGEMTRTVIQTSGTTYEISYAVSAEWSWDDVTDAGQHPSSVSFSRGAGQDATVPVVLNSHHEDSGDGYEVFSYADNEEGVVGFSQTGSNIPSSLTITASFTGGVFDGDVSSVEFVGGNMPAPSLFSAETFNAALSGQFDGLVNFSAFEGGEGADEIVFGIALYSGSGLVASSMLDVEDTSYDFGSLLLEDGEFYQMGLFQGLRFGDVGYISATIISFTAIPEPGTWAAIAGVAALGLVLVKRGRRTRA